MYRRQAPIFLQRQNLHAIRKSSKLQISLSSGAIRFGQIILDATICNRLSPKNMRKLRISWTGSDASPARMTGTGSSVFAAFKDKERADSVQSKLPQGMHSIVA